MLEGVASSFSGELGTRRSGTLGWGMFTIMFLACTWASLITWETVLIGPHGTPASEITSTHSATVFVSKISLKVSTHAARFSTRLVLVENRGSSRRSARPIAGQSRSHSP